MSLRDSNNLPVSNWSPASRFRAIVPNDDTDLSSWKIRGIYIGGTGNLRVLGYHDEDPETLEDVPGGNLLPMMVKKVFLTGTSATKLIAFI